MKRTHLPRDSKTAALAPPLDLKKGQQAASQAEVASHKLEGPALNSASNGFSMAGFHPCTSSLHASMFQPLSSPAACAPLTSTASAFQLPPRNDNGCEKHDAPGGHSVAGRGFESGSDDGLEDSLKMLAEDMIGDLWDAPDELGSLFCELAPGLSDGSINALSPASVPATAGGRPFCNGPLVLDCAPLHNGGSLPSGVAWSSFPPPNAGHGGQQLRRPASGAGGGAFAAAQGTTRDLPRGGASVRATERGFDRFGRAGADTSAPQDPSKEWWCKCGTLNKAGSHLCSSRMCHCYFCLGCGQLGHQQRFCRKMPPQWQSQSHFTPHPPHQAADGAGARLESGPARQPSAAAGALAERSAESRPIQSAQDPAREWRCKCGTLNKVGAFQCAKRGCRVFFCLTCGQLGHQQRFCRQGASVIEESTRARMQMRHDGSEVDVEKART
ncbi:MAG: hypothetical protein SGPRY_001655 [Prymnesium sp.]